MAKGAYIYQQIELTTAEWAQNSTIYPPSVWLFERLENGKFRMKLTDGEHTFAELPYVMQDVEVTVKQNDANAYILTITTAAGSFDTPNLKGQGVKITVKTNTATEYVLTITSDEGSFDTPNLKASSTIEVQTLSSIPDENTLTYEDSTGVEVAFAVGQMVRVVDSESDFGYKFYILYDITSEGKAVWGESGSGDLREKVRITLNSNQTQPDNSLIGATVRVYDNTLSEEVYSGAWNGEDIVAKVTALSDYTVTVGDVEGYTTPSAKTQQARIQGDRVLTFTYNACLLTVNLTTDKGTSEGIAGAQVTVSYGEVEKTISSGGSVKIPFGEEITLSASAVEGYGKPSDITVQADEATKTIEMVYVEGKENVIYIDQTVTDPNTMVSGDVNGDVIQWIRANSHRVLAKKTGEGTVTYCRLKDDDGTKYYDGTAADLTTNGIDVFMKLPKFYYYGTEGDTVELHFADTKLNDNFIEWDENTLIGVYEGYYTQVYGKGNMVYSRSSVGSTGSVSQENWKAYAANRGQGYQLVDWQMHCVMGCLYYAMYGNTNCQAEIGSGTNDYQKATGQTDSLGMTDTKASTNGNSQSINFWGLENWWGNKSEWLDDYENKANTLVATVNDPVTGGTRELDIPGAGYTGNYPKKMKFGKYLDLVATDDDPKNGSDSIGYCDYQWWPQTTTSSTRVVLRSGGSSSSYGGVACADAYNDSSSTYSDYGSRLAFRGVATEAESVAIFKSLPVL